ncbi:hypothetical protein Peur_004405 [Populus x canadensis]
MTVGCEMDDQMTFPPIGWLCYLKIENTDSSVEALAAAMHSKAVIEANRAAATLLVHQLTSGSQGAKTVAARGIRLLARAFNADARAIPYLRKLLSLLRDLDSQQRGKGKCSSDIKAYQQLISTRRVAGGHAGYKEKIWDHAPGAIIIQETAG